MILAYIRIQNLYSFVEKLQDGTFQRTTQWGPGAPKQRSVISELKAAELCAFGDWVVCDKLKEAKSSRFPFQAILSELIE